MSSQKENAGLGLDDNAKTPIRRAVSAEPTSASAAAARRFLNTPVGSQLRGSTRSGQRHGVGGGGLSASGRKTQHQVATTPHGREAIRTLDLRRAAVLTPHNRNRRRSAREQRETPRDFLRGLSKLLAPVTRPIASSSSPQDHDGKGAADGDGVEEEEDLPIDRPRLSLPIDEDEDEDESDLLPPRSSGLEEENYTMQSVELPRRALSEQPGRHLSIGSARMSDLFARYDAGSGEVGIDSAFFPPIGAVDDSVEDVRQADETYERLDSELGRLAANRESDFGVIDVPVDVNESTVVLAPQLDGFSDPPDVDDGVTGLDDAQDFASDEEEEVEIDVVEQTGHIQAAATKKAALEAKHKRRGVKLSRHGIKYPSLPPGVVKRLAQRFAQTSGVKAKISADTLTALMQASDWFMEQISDDLAAYAKHAGRKTIDDADMITLMKRQRQIGASTTPFALAQRYLPRELLQEMRMPMPKPAPKRRKGAVDEAEEVT